ncbi:MAG: tetratricopeptide repeat protein [Luteolibacter sp.]
MSAFKRAISLQPQNHRGYNNLGVALRELNEVESAIKHFRKAVELAPADIDSQANLANALLEHGVFEEASTLFGRLARLDPSNAGIQARYGAALLAHGDRAAAKCALQEAIRLDSRLSRGHDMLASIIQQEGDVELAIRHYQTAIDLDPAIARAHSNLGNAYITCGLLDDAISCFVRALELDSSLALTHDLLLYWLNYSSKVTMDEIAGVHAVWRKHIVGTIPVMSHPKTGHTHGTRRLRVGYMSPDFRDHVMARFILPILENHDRHDFEIFCYSNAGATDEVTERCRGLADHWTDITRLSDEQAARHIREARIDILVDLAMHSSGNRLGVFARKPAPIQVTYLSNVSTTGLRTVDYRIGDPFLDPPDWRDPSYTEETLRMPHTTLCYTPPDELEIAASPFFATGRITFGNFNNFCKVNEAVLELWARILRAVPDSRLMMLVPKGHAQIHTRRFMEGSGILAERLLLVERVPKEEYLSVYNQIDIALDPFPYQGSTTTCDALWMSCPVVTYAGERGVERVGQSILENIGHPELVGKNLDEYAEIAIRLANDPARLANLRSSLRQALASSPLMDAAGFTSDLENLYRDMWHR